MLTVPAIVHQNAPGMWSPGMNAKFIPKMPVTSNSGSMSALISEPTQPYYVLADGEDAREHGGLGVAQGLLIQALHLLLPTIHVRNIDIDDRVEQRMQHRVGSDRGLGGAARELLVHVASRVQRPLRLTSSRGARKHAICCVCS